jgi:hypothetical protein
MRNNGNRLFYFPIHESNGLISVRAFVEGATTPDPLFDRSSRRLNLWLDRASLKAPYIDPILI